MGAFRGETVIERAGAAAARLAQRFVPDPFVFALLLTLLTGALAVAYGPQVPRDALRHEAAAARARGETALAGRLAAEADGAARPEVGLSARAAQVARYWIDPDEGFWFLLKFGMQMTVILVTGFALATTPILRRLIGALADLPRRGASAAALVAFVAMAAAFVHWGLGLIVGALLARAVGLRARARGVPVHYPLLGAAGYVGLMVWHGGWSGSGPLIFATDQLGMLGNGEVLPFSRTILGPMNLTVSILLLALVPVLFALLSPRDPAALEPCPLPPEGPDGTEGSDRPEGPDGPQGPQGEDARGPARRAARGAARELPPETPAERLNRSRLLAAFMGLAGLVAVGLYATRAARPDQIAVINGVFLFAGLILHGTPVAYARAVAEGTRGAAGIILQFPFYAGIMGMMSGAGLAGLLSDWFAHVSTAASFPAMAFLSAAVVNVFVPSGGGQVAVQGQVLVDAARSLGVPVSKAVMALAYGDELTNMLQPFWALALLGITGLEARQIMGYTLLVMLLSIPLFLLPLTFF